VSRSSFRRGPDAILAAAGELGVREQVEAAGLRVLRQSGPWLFHQCPNYDDHAHHDRRPSAQSNVESGHWQCFGCGASGRWPGFHGPAGGGRAPGSVPEEVPELAPVGPFEPAPTRETSWEYTDELGNVVFWISRGAGKEFRPLHRNRHGTTVVGLTEYRPLYRLPELVQGVADGRTVYVAEGEKDVESLRAHGEVATCSVGGAGKFGRAAESERLKGATVVVVADRDRPGLRHALDVKRQLEGVAASVEVVLPAVGKDVSDHLHNGLGVNDLVPYEKPRTALGAERGDDLVWHSGAAMPAVPPVEWIAYPFAIVGGSGTHFIGRPKVAKTTYLMALCEAVISGAEFLGRPTVGMPVVYLSEQAAVTFHRQFHPGLLGNPNFHYALKPENPGWGWGDFVRLGVQKCELVGSRLLIFDTVGKFARFSAESEYSASQVRNTLDALDLAKGKGISTILAMHTNQKGADTDTIVGTTSGSHAWDAEADLLLKVTRKRGEHVGKLFNEGRVQEAVSEWRIRYDPPTHNVTLADDEESADDWYVNAVESGLSTTREIAEAKGVARNTASTELNRLASEGRIRKDDSRKEIRFLPLEASVGGDA